MKRIIIGAVFLLAFHAGYSQNCTQLLRTARQTYEQGRLHEVQGYLEKCLAGNDFTQSQKVEAYRIMILTYIYLEEPAKADEMMIALLRTDHFFRPSEASDPIEFQSLFKKFRTNPVFSIGLKIGLNTNHFNVQKNYYMFGPGAGKGEYKANLGFHFGLFFEKAIREKKNPDRTRFIIAPEVFYTGISYLYTNGSLSTSDETEQPSTDNLEYTIKHNRLQLNALVQYRFLKGKLDRTFSPYVSLGPSIYYRLNSSFAGDLTVSSQKTIPSLDVSENYKSIGVGILASAGMKYKVGGIYITADIRYIHGLNNIVLEKNRYAKSEVNVALQDAGYIDNDFTLSQSMVNVGLIVPYFNPKKTIR